MQNGVCVYLVPLLFAETEVLLQGAVYGRTTECGCLRRTLLRIKISRSVLNTKGPLRGSLKEVRSRNGSLNRPRPYCESMESVRSFVPLHPPRYS